MKDSRDCDACGRRVDPSKPDPCFEGYLSGVEYACCGHGGERGYITFESGQTFYFPKGLMVYQVTGYTIAHRFPLGEKVPIGQGSPRSYPS